MSVAPRPSTPSSLALRAALVGALVGALDLAVGVGVSAAPIVSLALVRELATALAGGAAVCALATLLWQRAVGVRANAWAAAFGLAWILGAERKLEGDIAAPRRLAEAPAPEAPNVLLVTVDSLRADHVGAWGGGVDTRHLDSLAREGVRFTRAIASSPRTARAHASLFRGRPAWALAPAAEDGARAPATLPDLLRAQGWRTGAFLGAEELAGELPGWSYVDAAFLGLRPRARAWPVRLWKPRAGHSERSGVDTVDAALAWIAGQQGPWMAWVQLHEPAAPYAPPPPWDTRYYTGDPTDPANASLLDAQRIDPRQRERLSGITDAQWALAQYAGEVSAADAALGRLRQGIPDTGRPLLTVLVGTHGENLGPEGLRFGNGSDVTLGDVHVPWVLHAPGWLPPGRAVDVPVDGADLAPTLLALLGLPVPEGMLGRDRSLWARATPVEGAGAGNPGAGVATTFLEDVSGIPARVLGMMGATGYRRVELDAPGAGAAP